MSIVSTVVLVCYWDGSNVAKAFEYNGHSQDHPMNMASLDRCGDCVGGTKCAETDIFVGAFNKFDHAGWFAHLETIEWQDPHQVVAIVQSSDLDFLTVWRPDGKSTK